MRQKNDVIEWLFFVLVLITSWVVILFCCRYLNTKSKLYHLEISYENYLKKAKNLEASSLKAKLDIEQWNKSNFSRLPFFNKIKSSDHKFLCVSILSKNRIGTNVKNYVNQAILALLTRTPLRYENKIKIVAINTEENPATNLNLINLNSIIHIENINSKINHFNLRIKEAADYGLVFQYLFNENCQNSIVMEDDAIITFEWFEKIKHSLDHISNVYNNEFAYIKLFTGYKFFDWDWLYYPNAVLKVCFYSILLTAFNYILITLNRLVKLSKTRKILLGINSLTIIILYNTTSVTPCATSTRLYSTGFGTVSILIPHSKLLPLSDYLNKTVSDYLNGHSQTFDAKDLIIDFFKTKHNFSEFIIEPSIVQHIGMHSALYNRDVSSLGFKNMYKSFSFQDSDKLIEFNPNIYD